jgi:hypothetical protein
MAEGEKHRTMKLLKMDMQMKTVPRIVYNVYYLEKRNEGVRTV